MTHVQQGRSITRTVQWYSSGVDPSPEDVTGLALRITQIGGDDVLVATIFTHVATGLYSYTWSVATDQEPDDYEWIWTCDPDRQTSETIEVVAALASSYATQTDLADYVTTVPANADLLLRRASRDVDRALLCSVYDAADSAVLAALTGATCEQVAGQLAAGATDGIGAGAARSFTLGKLSVNKGGAPSNPAAQAVKVGNLWEQAWNILQQAGLTGQGPAEPGGYW